MANWINGMQVRRHDLHTHPVAHLYTCRPVACSALPSHVSIAQDNNKQAILLLAFGVCCSEYPLPTSYPPRTPHHRLLRDFT